MSRRHLRRPRLAGLLAAALVLGASALPGGMAGADVAPADLTGSVVTPDNRPVPDATVLVSLLLPRDETAPQVYPTEVIAQAVTDAEGGFRIDLEPTREMLRAAAWNDHYVNFEITVTKVEQATGAVAEQVGGTASPATRTVFHGWELAYGKIHETGVEDPAGEVAGAVLSIPDPVSVETTVFSMVDATVAETGDIGQRNEYDGCGKFGPEVTVAERTVAFEPIGELHTYWDMSARLEYGATANTDLGGALQIRNGPWKTTIGAAHMGNKGTAVAITRGSHHGTIINSQFRYRKERLDFYGYGRRHCWSDHRIVPDRWHGAGINTGRDTSHNDGPNHFFSAQRKGYFGEFAAQSTWRKHKGRGYKYTWDANAFGVSLNAQSTWSNEVDIYYTFGPNNAAPHWLFAPEKHIEEARTVYAY